MKEDWSWKQERSGFYEKSDKVRIFEEIRTSHPDKVLLMSIECSDKTDLKLWFEPYNQEGGMEPTEVGIRFFADAFETLHCDQKCGVHLEGRTESCDRWRNRK